MSMVGEFVVGGECVVKIEFCGRCGHEEEIEVGKNANSLYIYKKLSKNNKNS